MALRDISNVTKTLINLIERAFRVPANWPPMQPVPQVIAEQPVRSGTDGIGIFLYHMVEDPHYKNLPAPGRDAPPVRYTSLGLTLYYQLSAHKSVGDVAGAHDGLMEQQFMAVAMKALHDYPELTDTTLMEGALDAFNNPITDPLFPLDIRGRTNRFRIILQPITPNEAVSFWSTGDKSLTLSAYYEVSVVLLEPETTQSAVGIVTDYNVFTFVTGNPKILGTTNAVSFTSPATGLSRTLYLQPAQVPPAPAVLPPDLTPYLLTIKGLDFTEQVFLRLSHSAWGEDTATPDAGWQATIQSTQMTVLVRETATRERDGASVDILPGIYGAQMVQLTTKVRPDGTEWKLELTSNVSPFAIVPRITPVAGAVPKAVAFNVTGHLFSATGPAPDFKELVKVEVMVGPYRLTRVNAAPAAGQFRVTNPTTIRIKLPSAVSSGEKLPLRIIANGAESSPLWITVA